MSSALRTPRRRRRRRRRKRRGGEEDEEGREDSPEVNHKTTHRGSGNKCLATSRVRSCLVSCSQFPDLGCSLFPATWYLLLILVSCRTRRRPKGPKPPGAVSQPSRLERFCTVGHLSVPFSDCQATKRAFNKHMIC